MKLKLSGGMNPIIVKELRSRMRGIRAFAVLTGVLLLLAGMSYLLYRIVLQTMQFANTPVSPLIGQTLFVGLAFIELMMVCFITPAVTAGTISGEQEKLTYEMLMATPLRPSSMLWGKLISALGYVFLLIFAAVPMASLVFIFGGVTLFDMLKALVMVAATAVTLGVIGVFMSASLGRTVRATTLSYLAVLTLIVGPLLVYIAVGVLRQKEPPSWILIPNPISALFSAAAPVSSYGGASGILSSLGMLLSGNISALNGTQMGQGYPRPLYHYTLPFYGCLSLALYLLSTRLVRPSRRWRIRWKEVFVVLALFVALAGIVAVPFLLSAGRYERRTPLPLTPTPALAVPTPEIIDRRGVQVIQIQVAPTMAPQPTEPSLPLPTTAPSRAGAASVPPPTPSPSDLSVAEQAAIYAAAIRQLYTVDNGQLGPLQLEAIYVSRVTDDEVGAANAPRGNPVVLSESLQAAVAEALRDMGPQVNWIDEVAGAMFVLGNVYPQTDGTVWVSGRFWYSQKGISEDEYILAKTYVLQRIDGVWRVVGELGT